MRFRDFLTVTLALVLLHCGYGGDAPPTAESSAARPVDDDGRGRIETTLSGTTVSVEYGRPELTAEGNVQDTGMTPSEVLAARPAGFVWRLGRNQATTLETDGALRFGSLEVPAGRYALFGRKEKDGGWSLVFNRVWDQWGAFDYDPERDLGAVGLQLEEIDDPVRRFTAELTSAEGAGRLDFLWGRDRLSVDFTVP